MGKYFTLAFFWMVAPYLALAALAYYAWQNVNVIETSSSISPTPPPVLPKAKPGTLVVTTTGPFAGSSQGIFGIFASGIQAAQANTAAGLPPMAFVVHRYQAWINHYQILGVA